MSRPAPSQLAPEPSAWPRETAREAIELLRQVIRGETTLAEGCRRLGLAEAEVEDWIEDALRDREVRGRDERVDDLRTIIDTIPILAWCAGADGAAEFFNQRWLDYSGLTADEVINPSTAAADRTRLPRAGCVASSANTATTAPSSRLWDKP